MKKLIILLLGVAVIIGLIFLSINLSKSAEATDTSLIAFAVKDTAEVDRIELFDSYKNEEFILVRNNKGIWEDQAGNCVQQEIVQMMLETMLKINLKGYVTKSAMKNMKKIMMSQHKKVKIFQDGKWTKTWYVGHSTQDHMGTHMLLETPDMKSDNPVIMGMKGFYGILEPRFFADARRFACTQLFTFSRNEIKEVEVINNVYPEESYAIKTSKAGGSVYANGLKLDNVNQDNLLFYLNGFENVHFNQPNYTLSEKDIDSMKSITPDYKLKITGKSEDYALDFYRRPDPNYEDQDTLAWDLDYLWAVKPDGEVVRIQFYTIGPLIQGKTVFVNN